MNTLAEHPVTDLESALAIANFDITFYSSRLAELGDELTRRYDRYTPDQLAEYHRQLEAQGFADSRFEPLNMPEISVVVFKLEQAKTKRATLISRTS